MPKLVPQSLKSRILAGKERIADTRAYVGRTQLTVYDRSFLRSAGKGIMSEPNTAGKRAQLNRLIGYGFMQQVDVFPSKYAITERGKVALASALSATKLGGVSLTITPQENKALKALVAGDISTPLNKAEKSILDKLSQRKLVSVSPKGYSVTKLGKAVLRESG